MREHFKKKRRTSDLSSQKMRAHQRAKRVSQERGTTLIGIVQKTSKLGLGLRPIDKKNMSRSWRILPNANITPEVGDVVKAKIVDIPKKRFAEVRVLSRLGTMKSEKAISQLALYTHDIPHIFSKNTEVE